MIGRQSSILGYGRHVLGRICGGGSDCEPKNLLRYAHPTAIGNQNEATWQIIKDNSTHF